MHNVDERFIIGFKNRNKPKCPENVDVSVCMCTNT